MKQPKHSSRHSYLIAWITVTNSYTVCPAASSGKFSPSRMLLLGFSPEPDDMNISRQCCTNCMGFLSRDVSTSNWHALSSRLCLVMHLHTWLMIYIWFLKDTDGGYAPQPTDRMLFHAHTTHLVIGALLLLGHVSGSVFQHICVMRTLHTTVSGMHSKRFGFNCFRSTMRLFA